MKKKLLLFAAILFLATTSFATTYTISVGGMSFSPPALTVHPGDIIKWIWSDGTHTTTSTSVPPGATSWDSPINSSVTSFTYTATVIGTYHYQCTFHVSFGMVGTITVVGSTGAAPVNTTPVFSMFPNPSTGAVHLQFDQPLLPALLTVTDMNGRQVFSNAYNGMTGADLDLKGVPAGNYIISAQQAGITYKKTLVVVH